MNDWLKVVRATRLAAAFLLALAHGGCVINSALDAARDQPIGEAHLVDPQGVDVDFSPTSCTSGEWQHFLGADFSDFEGRIVRVIVDPLGNASLRFFERATPLTTGTVFQREDCEPFHLSLERTGWEINEIYDLRVSMEFSCRSASGASASGRLSSGHCH